MISAAAGLCVLSVICLGWGVWRGIRGEPEMAMIWSVASFVIAGLARTVLP